MWNSIQGRRSIKNWSITYGHRRRLLISCPLLLPIFHIISITANPTLRQYCKILVEKVPVNLCTWKQIKKTFWISYCETWNSFGELRGSLGLMVTLWIVNHDFLDKFNKRLDSYADDHFMATLPYTIYEVKRGIVCFFCIHNSDFIKNIYCSMNESL